MSPKQSQNFPLGQIVGAAYKSLYDNFAYGLRICWAWIIVMTSARVTADIIKTSVLTDTMGEPVLGFDLTFFIGWFLFIPLASIAVAWHRLLLMGERDTSPIYLRLDRLVMRYLGLAVLLYVISLSPIFVSMSVGQIMKLTWGISSTGSANQAPLPGFFLSPSATSVIAGIQVLAVLMFIALTARLSVALPGKALGIPGLSIKRTWEVTRGHSWALMMGLLFCVIPFLLLSAFLRRSGFDYSIADGPLLHVADWLALESLGAVIGLIEVAYISYCFMHFFPKAEQQE